MKDVVDVLNQRIAELEAENERLRKELNFYDNKCEFCGSPLGLLHQESCPLCESRADIEELEADNGLLRTGVSNCAKTVDQLMTENERLREEIERYKRTTNERVAGYKSQWKRDAERYRKCIHFDWLHSDYDPTGNAWEEKK